MYVWTIGVVVLILHFIFYYNAVYNSIHTCVYIYALAAKVIVYWSKVISMTQCFITPLECFSSV